MSLFEASRSGLTLRQRWATYLTLLVALGLFAFGLSRQSAALSRKTFYSDTETGISVSYPANWLRDRSGDYVLRVRDMARKGFKTTLQVALIPIGADVQTRNVADRLTLSRAQTLTDYSVLAIEPYVLDSNEIGIGVLYTYVARESSPFLQGLPEVIVGYDVIKIARGQAVVATFRAEAGLYESEFHVFEDFLRSLVF
ncbi:MAG: hypothetical protein RML73_08435 [Anaerolineae bacterium]|nr:hypothetical protein [Anaerolineae bacterium]